MTAFLANAAGEGAWGFGADAGVGAGVGVVACSVASVTGVYGQGFGIIDGGMLNGMKKN